MSDGGPEPDDEAMDNAAGGGDVNPFGGGDTEANPFGGGDNDANPFGGNADEDPFSSDVNPFGGSGDDKDEPAEDAEADADENPFG